MIISLTLTPLSLPPAVTVAVHVYTSGGGSTDLSLRQAARRISLALPYELYALSLWYPLELVQTWDTRTHT